METDQYIDIYKTPNLDIATVLLTSGFNVTGISGSSRDAFFMFIDDENLRSTVEDYYNGNLRIDPKSLFSSRKELVNRLRENTANVGESGLRRNKYGTQNEDTL